MKYLKTYEDKVKIYQEEDYVLLDIEKIEQQNKRANDTNQLSHPDDSLAKIINIGVGTEFNYKLKFYNEREYRVSIGEIIRLLTPEEIEEFESKRELFLDTNKYNL